MEHVRMNTQAMDAEGKSRGLMTTGQVDSPGKEGLLGGAAFGERVSGTFIFYALFCET